MIKSPLVWLIVLFITIGLVAALAPLEKTLGANARLVYLHGAWVWTAMLAFLAAALAGLVGLITRRPAFHQWSQALGRTGLFFWITFLLMSLYVMQVNWNGLFLSEPRFRIPLNFAIAGLLLQAGLAFFKDPRLTSFVNASFGLALFFTMSGTQTVLHPDSPIFNSGARSIQIFFGILLILQIIAAWQLSRCILEWQQIRKAST